MENLRISQILETRVSRTKKRCKLFSVFGYHAKIELKILLQLLQAKMIDS